LLTWTLTFDVYVERAIFPALPQRMAHRVCGARRRQGRYGVMDARWKFDVTRSEGRSSAAGALGGTKEKDCP
jgi:hypothetical protein